MKDRRCCQIVSDSRWQEAQSKARPQQGNGDYRSDREGSAGSSRGDVHEEQAHEDTQNTSSCPGCVGMRRDRQAKYEWLG